MGPNTDTLVNTKIARKWMYMDINPNIMDFHPSCDIASSHEIRSHPTCESWNFKGKYSPKKIL